MSERLLELIDICNANNYVIESFDIYYNKACIRDLNNSHRVIKMCWTGKEWIVRR